MLNLLNFVDINLILIVVGSVVVGVGLICAVIAVLSAVKNGRPSDKKKKVGDGTVSADEYLEEIEIRDEKLILVRNVIYSVGENGQIARGSYILANAIEGGGALNVRFNGLVREFQEGTKISVTDGDTICCVSGSATLKAL